MNKLERVSGKLSVGLLEFLIIFYDDVVSASLFVFMAYSSFFNTLNNYFLKNNSSDLSFMKIVLFFKKIIKHSKLINKKIMIDIAMRKSLLLMYVVGNLYWIMLLLYKDSFLVCVFLITLIFFIPLLSYITSSLGVYYIILELLKWLNL